MLGHLVASADPDPVATQDVIDETGKRGGASRLAGEFSRHVLWVGKPVPQKGPASVSLVSDAE